MCCCSLKTYQTMSSTMRKVSSNIGADSNIQAGSSMQVEREPTWMPGPLENPASGTPLPGLQPLDASQMGSSIQPPRPQQQSCESKSFSLMKEMYQSTLVCKKPGLLMKRTVALNYQASWSSLPSCFPVWMLKEESLSPKTPREACVGTSFAVMSPSHWCSVRCLLHLMIFMAFCCWRSSFIKDLDSGFPCQEVTCKDVGVHCPKDVDYTQKLVFV